jgi:hypothetical protein
VCIIVPNPSIALGFVFALVDSHGVVRRGVEDSAGYREACRGLNLAKGCEACLILVAVVAELCVCRNTRQDTVIKVANMPIEEACEYALELKIYPVLLL